MRRSPRQGAALAVAAKARDMMKLHHVLADPKEGTQKTPSDPAEETREAPSNRKDQAQGMPSDP